MPAPRSLTDRQLLPYDPVANEDAVVESGNARFTVLTDRLIRMEYSENGKFLDKATLAFVNRKLSVRLRSLAAIDSNEEESATMHWRWRVALLVSMAICG